MLVEHMDRVEANLRTEMKEGFQDQDQKRNLATQALTKRIDGTDAKIEKVEASLTKRIDSLAEEVRELRGEVREVRTDIRERIAPRLDDHEARIASLEGKPAA
jgi:peptidoglycan hydrolase CwlO-like protein